MSQHDFTVENGTGAEVRADLNLALAALASSNSGASAPATTFANQLWYDTSNKILKIRNAANTGWINLLRLDQTGSNAFPAPTNDTSVTAAGTTRSDATEVAKGVLVIASGSADTGIKFAADLDEVIVRVRNATASAKKIYPGSGGAVDGGTTDEALSLPAGLPVTIFIKGANLWTF